MPSVQVKDFPQSLYDRLRVFAEANHRSMSQQLIVAAEQMMLDCPPGTTRNDSSRMPEQTGEQALQARIEKRRALFARCDATIAEARRRGVWTETDLDSAEFVRADRDGGGRHGGGPEYEVSMGQVNA